ncbi:hypothetical protein BZA05DRAFT_410060 [Tricharina praecox]|uniref:uncharacterized protein n=1 Tax=Tricharina praecox TaxID=43433 RepID=UPI002220A4BA|nr:uncharacterized protein BZA05DRAFT_410060 [Tricharina praecox]KAI5844140.1 hypothetical protein BZA05DRAFT_410060 [Tricharina praecox]
MAFRLVLCFFFSSFLLFRCVELGGAVTYLERYKFVMCMFVICSQNCGRCTLHRDFAVAVTQDSYFLRTVRSAAMRTQPE